MSGHNKWSKIKHKKAKTDVQKGRIFSKIVREVMVAAKTGGADPSANYRLAMAIQKAKEANMPSDNIKRAIQKGAGDAGGADYEEFFLEAYAPNGVALLIKVLTDNRNRTTPNIRTILSKYGGSMASKGAVAYLFDAKGQILFEPGTSEETVMEIATENGADDMNALDDGSIEVYTAPEILFQVQSAFDSKKIPYASASLEMIAKTNVDLTPDQTEKALRLVDKLEEDEDVQDVYANFDAELET